LLFQVTVGAVPTSPVMVTASRGLAVADGDELVLLPHPARATVHRGSFG
jgi:hypothetical protein